MTNLERLIKAHVEGTVVATVSATTAKLAEEWAREALRDPAFRDELLALVRQHVGATFTALRRNGHAKRRTTRASRGRRGGR
jgi:hypothetical protein